MLVTRAVRPTLRVARQAKAVRYAHFENVVDQTIPGGTKNKAMFTIRFLIFVGVGAGLPFAASAWQQHKAAGGA